MSVDHSRPPDYEAIEQEAWRKAHNKVGKEASSRTSRLIKRIQGFMWRFGYTENAVLDKIRDDSMFAAWFAKEPRRTGFHEAIAADWIRTLPDVLDFRVLPKSGKNAVKVSSDGNIESETPNRKLPGKSLDFKWKTGSKTFYAMHSGGNQDSQYFPCVLQDSQYKEMVELMKRFVQCQNRDVVLLIIVDGKYYQEKDQARLKELKNNQRDNPPRSYALSIGEVPDIINHYNTETTT